MINYQRLKQQYGSPLYVYNLTEITDAYEHLRYILPARTEFYYSLKANPNLAVVTHLHSLGCKLEISSIGELNISLLAGADPKDCLYTGPGKTEKEIKYAISKGVRRFSIESEFELAILMKNVEHLDEKLVITIRVNPQSFANKASINMTGVSSQFGVEEKDIPKIIEILKTTAKIVLNGFHIYNGSNFRDENNLLINFKNNLRTISRLVQELHVDISFVDLGGGFAAPYAKEGTRVDYTNIKEPLSELIKDFSNSFHNLPIVAFEIGRYFTATSGVLIGTIQNVKESKEKKYCVTDFGINHLGGMGGLKRLPYNDVEVKLWEKRSDNLEETIIVGPLCTPLDYISKRVLLPKNIKPNEIVYIPNVGAYGLTASLLGFLSREIPKEVVIEDERVISVSQLKLIAEGDANGKA